MISCLESSTNTAINNRIYQYDQASQISNITNKQDSRNFSYDAIDRLTGVTGNVAENYAFDAVGNRTSSHLSATYTTQPFNKLTATANSSFAYDANGNMTSKTDPSGTWTYEWDFENRLKKVTRPDGQNVVYEYDGLGRRVERLPSSGVSTKFVYDGLNVFLDQNSDGSSVKYINGFGIDSQLGQITNGTTKYLLKDHLGSTTGLMDATGNVTESTTYDSFGKATTPLSTRYQYTGREYDEFSGLYFYRARWFDANLGRFISEDPIGLGAGINQFSYVGNDSLNSTDPMGLYEKDVHYYLTYYLAKRTGCFGESGSRAIASGNQGTDENPDLSPGPNKRFQNSAYHALNSHSKEGVGSGTLWAGALNGGGNELGVFLHSYQDSFSHAGFTNESWGHSPISLFFGDKWGTHRTDKTNYDVPKAMRMARGTFSMLLKYAETNGCGCNPIWTQEMQASVSAFVSLPGGNSPWWVPISNSATMSIEDASPFFLNNKKRALGF